jgi:hypothetical protein
MIGKKTTLEIIENKNPNREPETELQLDREKNKTNPTLSLNEIKKAARDAWALSEKAKRKTYSS